MDIHNTPIEQFRRIARWVDSQSEDWWLPIGTPPTIEQIIAVYYLVTDRCNCDTIESAYEAALEKRDLETIRLLDSALNWESDFQEMQGAKQ